MSLLNDIQPMRFDRAPAISNAKGCTDLTIDTQNIMFIDGEFHHFYICKNCGIQAQATEEEIAYYPTVHLFNLVHGN